MHTHHSRSGGYALNLGEEEGWYDGGVECSVVVSLINEKLT